jgi:hypothetical protein
VTKFLSTIADEGERTMRILRLALVLAMLGSVPLLWAQEQKTFDTPQAALQALYDSAKADDEPALLALFGPGGKEILSSGDPVADANAREWFVADYAEAHRLVPMGANRQLVDIGRDAFPFPIPLVKSGSRWRFDTEAGKEEVLYRRIGHNELDAIDVCHAFVDAQKEYASVGRNGDHAGIYAAKLVSDPGKQNGLYWETGEFDPPSPIGDLLAGATEEGYGGTGGKAPFHGYYYRLLTAQGPAAKGGVMTYTVDGKLRNGYAIVAYPAEYRTSGVMTFIVSQAGTVYEKDLGDKTQEVATQMKDFNPDKSWRPVR